MPKFRFTPDMFPGWHPKHIQTIADQANAALDEHLKGLERVYLHGDGSWCPFGVTNQIHKTALLFNVEELKPKECEHVALTQFGHEGQIRCNDCGKVLEYSLVVCGEDDHQFLQCSQAHNLSSWFCLGEL